MPGICQVMYIGPAAFAGGDTVVGWAPQTSLAESSRFELLMTSCSVVSLWLGTCIILCRGLCVIVILDNGVGDL